MHAEPQTVLAGPEVVFVSFAPNPDPPPPTANGTVVRSFGARDSIRSIAPSPASLIHADLAGWLLAREGGTAAESSGLVAAAEQVSLKLSGRLSRLVSPAGSQAILSRALHLARVDFGFFDGVHAGTAPGTCLIGLDDQVRDISAGEVRHGLLALLGLVLDLLIAFIGEDLTLRLVREVWPDLPSLAPSRPGRPDGQKAP